MTPKGESGEGLWQRFKFFVWWHFPRWWFRPAGAWLRRHGACRVIGHDWTGAMRTVGLVEDWSRECRGCDASEVVAEMTPQEAKADVELLERFDVVPNPELKALAAKEQA